MLIHDYDSHNGGAEGGTFDLRDGLRARGHEARLFASRARPAGVSGQADYETLGTFSPARTALQAANPWAAQDLWRTMRAYRPDVVHVRMFLTQLSPLILPALSSTPSLYHAVWYRAVCPKGTKLLPDLQPCSERAGLACLGHGCLSAPAWSSAMVQRGLLRRRWRVFDRVIANSRAVAHALVADGLGEAEVVWNGVRARPVRAPLSDPPTVGFAGRFVPEKGVLNLVRAFAKVVRRSPNAQLLMIGDGPERPSAQALAQSLGVADQTTFTGQLPRDETNRRLDAAWVQAAPSVWAEPFGFVAAEAMMRGTAVVASGGGGLAEIVQDGVTGRMVGSDPDSLAQALTPLLPDRDLAERLGASGRSFALAHLTLDRWIDRFETIYREMTGELADPVAGRAFGEG